MVMVMVKKNSKVKKNENISKKEKVKNDDDPEALFIPAGVLTGLGLGFLYGNIVAGLFLGLGAGFILFALIAVIKSLK